MIQRWLQVQGDLIDYFINTQTTTQPGRAAIEEETEGTRLGKAESPSDEAAAAWKQV